MSPGVKLRCLGAVLAGGASSRMGVDKAFIEIDGTAMVLRAVEALRRGGADPTVVVGGDGPRLASAGLHTVADRFPGEGPLGAIITALEALDSLGEGCEAAVTLPCDVPAPDAAAVSAVIDRLATGDADVVVPQAAGSPQWTHAAWRRSCLESASEAFTAGVRSPRDAAQRLNVATIDIAAGDWCRDADRPEDLPPRARAARERSEQERE